jgi:hypothetical protein
MPFSAWRVRTMLMDRILAGSTFIVPFVVGLIAPSFLRGIGFVVAWAAITGLMQKMPLSFGVQSAAPSF